MQGSKPQPEKSLVMKKKRKLSKTNPEEELSSSPVTMKDSLASFGDIEERELCCTVCFLLPEKFIYQCSLGHLLCDECYEQLVVNGEYCKCPTCKIPMGRECPNRSKIAELFRSNIIRHCHHLKCGKSFPWKDLSSHEKSCKYRPVLCPYARLGCQWTGMELESTLHHKSCKWLNQTGKSILKATEENHQKYLRQEMDLKNEIEHQKQILSIFSERCRDLVVRDLRFVYCDIVEHLICKPIKVFHYFLHIGMKKCLLENGNPVISFQIQFTFRNKSGLDHAKIPAKILIMKGPTLNMEFPPLCKTVCFDGTETTILIELQEPEISRFMNYSEISLRVVFLDLRPGLSHHFSSIGDSCSAASPSSTTQPQTFESSASSREEEDDDEGNFSSDDDY
eukprot:Sdes_comp22175_c0_seq1m20687